MLEVRLSGLVEATLLCYVVLCVFLCRSVWFVCGFVCEQKKKPRAADDMLNEKYWAVVGVGEREREQA